MAEYREGSHSRFDLKIHVVWITKYRKKVLVGDIAVRVRELIREICLANDIQIVKGHGSQDHIHLLISYPAHMSVSKIVQYLKGKSSRKLLQEYTELRKKFWGQHIWARGYFAVSTGTVTDEVIKQYIENQSKDEMKDEDFKIGDAL
jgi:putative transposase